MQSLQNNNFDDSLKYGRLARDKENKLLNEQNT